MNYDVFISCKSEDYKCAEAIYDYLKNNDIHAFLASKELRQMGESEYRRAISKAMKSAYHIIIFASKAEFIDSTWVYYEWDMFLNAKLKGRKEGQILTILKDVEVDDINMDLWKYESFTLENFKEKILPYIETPASQLRKEQAKRKAQEEAEKVMKQKQAEQRISKIKKEIQEYEVEYFSQSENLNRLAKNIVAKQKEIGVNKKTCPICGESTFIDNPYCKKCGWTFTPLYSTKTFASEEQLFIARNNWNIISNGAGKGNNAHLDETLNKYKKEIAELNAEIDRLKDHNRFLENAYVAHNTVTIGNDNGKKEYKITLKETGPAKMQIVKLFVEKLGWGLKDAKDFVDNVPSEFPMLYSKNEKNEISRLIESCGGAVRVELASMLEQNNPFADFKTGTQNLTIEQANIFYGYKQYNIAVYIYRSLAEQGNSYAQYNLGVCYENGDGVKQDYLQAVKWYRKAAEKGNKDAIKRLKELNVQ